MKQKPEWFFVRRSDGRLVVKWKQGSDWPSHTVPKDIAASDREARRYAEAYVAERLERHARTIVLAHVKAGANDAKGEGATLRSLSDPWLALRRKDPKLSHSIRAQNESNLRVHVLAYPEIADAPVTGLGPALLRAWLRKIRDGGKVKIAKGGTLAEPKLVRTGEPLAPLTCRNVVATLTTFLDDAIAEEWVTIIANPMRSTALRRELPEGTTRAGRRTIIHFSRAVVETLVTSDTTPEIRKVRYVLAATSGMRDGEIAALQWSDIDLGDATVDISKSLQTRGPDGWATIGKTKTEDSQRKLPLHPTALKLLKAWKASGWLRWTGQKPKPTDYVFCNEQREAHRPSSAALLRGDLEKADLPVLYREKYPYDFHAFRRSFYTWLREAGVERDTVAMMMGHRAPDVGEEHYGARSLERMRKAIREIKLRVAVEKAVPIPLRAIKK